MKELDRSVVRLVDIMIERCISDNDTNFRIQTEHKQNIYRLTISDRTIEDMHSFLGDAMLDIEFSFSDNEPYLHINFSDDSLDGIRIFSNIDDYKNRVSRLCDIYNVAKLEELEKRTIARFGIESEIRNYKIDEIL